MTEERLTLEALRGAGACGEGTRYFEVQWPGEPPTWAEVAHALAGHESGLSWWRWLINCDLVPAVLVASYDRAIGRAWDEYLRVTRPAWNEYGRAATVVAEAAALTAYKRATDAAYAKYRRAKRKWLRSVQTRAEND